ncbi:MAG TPA: 6-bladed beta-propeller [Gammaproteobacteria bacterium]|nr:6-bladed beta-propeller [Gammaproteobacteria bacterium]
MAQTNFQRGSASTRIFPELLFHQPLRCRARAFLSLFMLALILMPALFLSGCGGSPVKEKVDLVWPPPPEQPRVRYLGSYSSQLDLKGRSSLKARLLGEDPRGFGLQKPYGVTATDDGRRIYVADTKRAAIVVFDFDTKKVYPFQTDAAGALQSPIEVRVDSRGRLYVTDPVRSRLFIFSPEGKTLYALGASEKLERPTGLALDEQRERIYVADRGTHRILVYNLDGEFQYAFGERGTGPEQFNLPINLAVDRDGNLYVVDFGNFRVQMFSSGGDFLGMFGEAGDKMGNMARPKGIAVDSDGHIYVVDAAFGNFQIFNREGRILLFVGQMGHNPGQFWLPTGMYINAQNRIYVSDSLNARIQVFQYLPEQDMNGR